MRVVYFQYWFEKQAKKHKTSIEDFLRAFTGIADVNFKSSFSCPGGTVLLCPVAGRENIYAFLITKEHELIKSVGRADLSINDIESKIGDGEQVAFASYLKIERDWLAMVSSFHGPKAHRFAGFMNDLLDRVGLDGIRFCCAPFATTVDKETALNFAFKSSVKMKVGKKGNALSSLLSALGGPADVSWLDINIKPARGKKMDKGFNAALKLASDPGIEKLIVRGSEEIGERVSEFFVIGNGAVTDAVSGRDEGSILQALDTAGKENGTLKEAIREYRNDDDFERDAFSDIDRFGNVDGWGAAVDGGARRVPARKRGRKRKTG